jgi:hypothetical protein
VLSPIFDAPAKCNQLEPTITNFNEAYFSRLQPTVGSRFNQKNYGTFFGGVHDALLLTVYGYLPFTEGYPPLQIIQARTNENFVSSGLFCV